jgi:hypothetical protein
MFSSVDLKTLYELSEEEMMQMIFSSGDYFPGFYRYTLGTQKVGDESLGLSTLIWLFFEQNMTNKKHHKEFWLDLQHEIHDRDVASESARNARNFPEVRNIFSDKMMDWYFKAEGYDIAYIDTELKVQEFQKNKTYYFMGSLINYSSGKLNVGFNSMTKEAALSIEITYEKIQEYLTDTFTVKQIEDLFLESEIVATLKFTKEHLGVLEMNEESIDKLLLRSPDIKVFGSPIESRPLPMRYAKCIRFTNFRRGSDGEFETWQTDQNW